jgi:hypothetical protein
MDGIGEDMTRREELALISVELLHYCSNLQTFFKNPVVCTVALSEDTLKNANKFVYTKNEMNLVSKSSPI